MAKRLRGKSLSHGKRQSTNATFSVDAVSGLFDRDKTKQEMYDDYFKTGNFHPDVWTQETVIRDENNSLSLYDEVVAGLSVPKSSLKIYKK